MANALLDISGLGGRPVREPPQLSRRVRSVLLGLLHNPGISDRALGRSLGLTSSMVGTARRALIGEGFLAQVRYASLHCIGVHAFALLLAQAPFAASWEASHLALSGFVRDTPEVLLAALGPRSSAFLLALKTPEELSGIRSRLLELAHRWGAPAGRVVALRQVPRRGSHFLSYPAFSPVAASLLDESSPVEGGSIEASAPRSPNLADLPRHRAEILRALLHVPLKSDERIARELGLTRQAVGKARAALAGEGWFSELWISSLGLLGAELVAFLGLPPEARGEREDARMSQPFLLQPFGLLGFWGRMEGMAVSVWDRFETLERTVAAAASEGTVEWLDPHEPHAAVFPLVETALLLRADLSDLLGSGKSQPNP